MKLAIILTLNKGEKENFNQIETLKTFVSVDLEILDGTDEEGNVISGAFQRTVYHLKDLNTPHELLVYHIVPFQPDNLSDPYKAILPDNFNDINSWNVQYGKGDEDKTGDHPRFFNWGLKRATDNGADVVLHLEDISKLSIQDIDTQLTKLTDTQDKTEFAEIPSGKLSTVTLLKKVGQLDEAKSISEAINDLKVDIANAGLEALDG